jgi:hypothetical protein
VKQISVGLLIFLVSVSPAWADEPVAEQTRVQLSNQAREMVALGVPQAVAARLQNRFQETQMAQVRAIVKAAKYEDLPIEPLVDKALEGIAKNVSAEGIVQALQQVRGRYAAAASAAREITPTRPRQRTLTRIVAQAMAAGMVPEDITSIADRLQPRQRDMTREECDELAEATFTAARDMVRMGTASEAVAETLNVALEGGYTAEQMQRIRSQFMHQAQQTDADMVANQFRERVRTGQDVADTGAGEGNGPGYGKDDGGATGHNNGAGAGDSGGGSGSGGRDGGADGGGGASGDNGGSSDAGGSGGSGGNNSAGGGNGSGGGNSAGGGKK